MNESVRLGRIAGVDVGVNWTVFLIFVLITFGLAAGRFPQQHPGLEPTAYVIAGVAAGVVFLASILAHEVSHAVVAQRNGVEVDGIVLWLFGGVARLRGEPGDPGAEIRVAGVGPLVSVVLGAAFGAIAVMLERLGAPGITVGVFGWLAVINVVLAMFNLVPAAPLDGGRILRGLLWKRRGDRLGASLTAARAGRAFGWLLVVLGLIDFVGGAGGGGLWLVLIGWFLTNAAGAEEHHAQVRHAVGDVRVDQVMTSEPVVVPSDLPVSRLIDDHVFSSRYSSFPLVDRTGRPAGLVTLNRVKQLPADRRSTTTVADIACPLDEVAVARPDESLADLLPRLADGSDGRALVLDGERLVGIVSPTDVAHQLEVADLRDARRPQHV
ncbi:MAG TPA: site-2 protease family protein [Acidimicrobiales bacterium]|nr:site-2 protease family protein [Acidimicrobiales bacterium]